MTAVALDRRVWRSAPEPFLPAFVATGVAGLSGRQTAIVAAPVLLLFLVLTALPIIVTPFVAEARGEVAAWGVVVPIAVITAIGTTLLVRLLVALPSGSASATPDGRPGAGSR